jgi:hypothetical protein
MKFFPPGRIVHESVENSIIFNAQNQINMKPNFLKTHLLIALSAIILVLSSCTKEKITAPAEQRSLTYDEVLQPGEVVASAPTSATIFVIRFIDNGADETAQFNGYIFEVQSDGNFIATTNTGDTFIGTWIYNDERDRVIINISGTPALDDLSGNWRVRTVTNQRLVLTRPGPDRVVFGLSEVN